MKVNKLKIRGQQVINQKGGAMWSKKDILRRRASRKDAWRRESRQGW